MNRPVDPTPEDEVLREVQDAYRNLPPIEPGADLDARVRAAVAAEVASGSDDAPAPLPRVLPFPRWRRAALPLAAAAAVLVAIGVDHLQQRPMDPIPAVVVARPAAPPPAGAPAVAPREAAQELRLMRPAPPPPPSYAPPAASTPQLDLPVVQGPAPVAKARSAPEPAALAAVPQQLEPTAGATASRAVTDAASETAKAPRFVAGLARAAPAAPAADDAAAFDEIRQLLAQKKRDEAIARLKRWREAHATAALPEDLKPLETAGGH